MLNRKEVRQGGMLFRRENEMTEPVRRWLNRQHLLIKSEFGLPWGICDLVGLSFNETQVAKRLSFRQRRPIGPLQRIELLSHIPDQESGLAITFNRLQKTAGHVSFATTLERDLRTLIADRFVVAKKNGALQKLNGWAPMHGRIVAVELKLSRISEAISQALSNRAFATESYIALPAKIAERFASSARQAEFTKPGVGILAVGKSTCRVVLPASQAVEPDVTLQMHCVERFWRTRDNSSSTAVRRVRVS
jgi:hypothetical protein